MCSVVLIWIPVTEAMATLPSPRTISGLQLCSVMMNKAMSEGGTMSDLLARARALHTQTK